MNAVVLAGGFGTRLMPLTQDVCKPMLNVANIPMIDYTVAHINSFGIKKIVFTLGYKPEQIIQYVDAYKEIKPTYVTEDTPLGTAGGVLAASKWLDDTFIVLSGDALENIDLAALTHKHFTSSALVTMAVTTTDNPHLYGVVEVDAFGKVIGFTEKPERGTEKSNLINCGVYVINKSVLDYIPREGKFDFARDLFPAILDTGKISAYIHDDYWCDIGDVTSYYNANFHFVSGGYFKRLTNKFDMLTYGQLSGGLDCNLLGSGASLVGQCRNSIIGANSRISSNSSVDNCIVMPDTLVNGRYINSILGKDFALTIPSGESYFYKIQHDKQINL